MQLRNIDDEVKRHLMILLLTVPKQKEEVEPYTSEELLLHLEKSNEAIKNGDVLTMEEAHLEMTNFISSL